MSIDDNMNTGQMIHPYAAPSLTMDPEALQQHFPGLMGKIGNIRSATQISPFTSAPFSGPSRSKPQSPLREHLVLQPSPFGDNSAFSLTELSPPLPPEKLLLRHFVANLPIDSPSPFKTMETFVECPTQKRTLIERPVSLKEPDDQEGHTRWVEMGLVYEEEPRYRAHCVMAGPSKVILDDQEHSAMEGICTVWTRKYPQGWEGVFMNDAGNLINYPSPIFAMLNTDLKAGNSEQDEKPVWMYSTAICVDVNGVETRIECPVPKKIVQFEGITYDLEPGWEDVVNALKKEFPAWEHHERSVQQHFLIEGGSPPKTCSQKPSKQNQKQSKKGQKPMHSPQYPPSLHRAVAQVPEQPLAIFTKPACIRTGDDMMHFADKECTTYHGMEPRRDFPSTQLNHHHGHMLQFHHQYNEDITVSSVTLPYPDEAALQHPHTHFNNETSVASERQPGAATEPIKETAKPTKRSRALTREKQVTSTEDVQESPGQSNQAAEEETPSSTEKYGSKRKRSTVSRTPTKKRATAKTSPASEVHDDGCETPDATQEIFTENHVNFGHQIASAHLGQFEKRQMTIDDPFHEGLQSSAIQTPLPAWNDQREQITNYLFSCSFENPGFVPYIQNTEGPMSGMHLDLGSRGHIPISQQLQLLDQHQAALIASFRSDRGVSEIQRVQYKLAELNAHRIRLLAMSSGNTMSADQFQMYPPYSGYSQATQYPSISAMQWNNRLQLDSPQVSAMQQNINQQLNYLPLSRIQSNISSQQNTFQLSGSQQNDYSLLTHSLSHFQSENQSPQVSTSRSHFRQPSDNHQTVTAAFSSESWATPEFGSLSRSGEFQSEARSATTYCATSNMSNQTPYSSLSQRVANNSTLQPVSGRHSTTPKPSIAEYPHNSVQNARGYVTSLLQIPMDQLLQTPWEEHQRTMRHRHEDMQRQKSTDQPAEYEVDNDPEFGEA